MDALKYAIENTDLPTLIAELYPDSGAQPNKEGRCVAAWRGGEKQSVALYDAGNSVSMYKDFATDKSGNCFHWLMDAEKLSPAEAAKFLIDWCNLNGSSTQSKKGLGKIETTYDYKDVHDNLVHQTVRYEGKVFRQRRPAPDGRVPCTFVRKYTLRGNRFSIKQIWRGVLSVRKQLLIGDKSLLKTYYFSLRFCNYFLKDWKALVLVEMPPFQKRPFVKEKNP